MAEDVFALEPSPHHDLAGFSFADFLHVFLLGDTSHLLAASPRGNGEGDVLKATLLLQVRFCHCSYTINIRRRSGDSRC